MKKENGGIFSEIVPDGGVFLGVDPGFSGAFVALDGKGYFRYFPMPVCGTKDKRRIDFDGVLRFLSMYLDDHWMPQIFLERAIPMAMGSKGAFSYGRGFEALLLAIEKSGIIYTLVEPAKWTKEMHEGIDPDLKAKSKSILAVKKHYSDLVGYMPKDRKGRLLDGPVDALLIAGYGLRLSDENYDFS